MRSARSNTVTRCPARASCCAQARPAGPEPTTATFLPVRCAGTCGATQPALKAWSMICFSICLMVTGSLLMLRTQASSHGAGQMRPVNSGKLLVECSRSIAVLPAAAVDEVVPVGDDVPERAALVAERDAAVHAARRLRLQLVARRCLPSSSRQSCRRSVDRPPRRQLAFDFQKSGDLTHVAYR